jgi:hypothetical protein
VGDLNEKLSTCGPDKLSERKIFGEFSGRAYVIWTYIYQGHSRMVDLTRRSISGPYVGISYQ